MSYSIKRIAFAIVIVLLGFGLCRAARFKWQDKQQAVFQACREELQKLGITRGAAKAKYPTPEIHNVSAACILPGETGEVVIRGKFILGTKFVFENDSLEVLKESMTGNEYRATVKAAAGAGPQTASVMAITPVTGITARYDNAAAIGGRYEWNMQSANGWRVVARPVSGGKACAEHGRYPHELLFYRGAETNPFEKRQADLYYSAFDQRQYRFSVSQQDAATTAEVQDMQTLMQKMSDPKLTDAQREQLMKQMQQMQAQMMANVKKMTDPSYQAKLQQQRLEFGCQNIELAVDAGTLKGEMSCSEKVGRRLGVTGTMKLVGR